MKKKRNSMKGTQISHILMIIYDNSWEIEKIPAENAYICSVKS